MQLCANGCPDIYLTGNPQKGVVPYGTRPKQRSHSNPYCPTLEYSFLDNKYNNGYGSKDVYEKYWGLPHNESLAGIPNKDLQGTVDFNLDDPNIHIILPDFPVDKLMTHIINEKHLPIEKSINYEDYEKEYKTTNREEILKEVRNKLLKNIPTPKKQGTVREFKGWFYVFDKYNINQEWKKELDNFYNEFITSYYAQYEYKDTLIDKNILTDKNLKEIIFDFLKQKGYTIIEIKDHYYII